MTGLVGRPRKDNLTLIEHEDSVRAEEGGRHIVGYKDGRDAPLTFRIKDKLTDVCRHNGIKASRRFIIKDDFRIKGKGTGEANALFIPQKVLRDRPFRSQKVLRTKEDPLPAV